MVSSVVPSGALQSQTRVSASMAAVNISASSGGETITLIDVLYGDVFFCSGQSNMEWSINWADRAAEERKAAAAYGDVRFFDGAEEVAAAQPLIQRPQVPCCRNFQ